ncbi:hypothetical protein [Micromonospora okii]|uniref:hypothetical protein n=1 Tax=Micromonospora okii TaxID=1182970 RepID=UPI001E321C63|nr:hypothetical protein [Micromonospora okii]
MPLKAIAVAATTAAILAAASPASATPASPTDEAWPPGNCQPGTFCVWPNWAPVNTGPTETPSLVTITNWSGNVPAKTYYNYTSQNFDVTWNYTFPDGEVRESTSCVSRGGNIFYLPVRVTKVSAHQGGC